MAEQGQVERAAKGLGDDAFATEAVVEFDADFKVLWANPGFCELFDVVPSKALGEALGSFFSPLSARLLAALAQQRHLDTQVLALEQAPPASLALLGSFTSFFDAAKAFQGGVAFFSEIDSHPVRDLFWSERRYQSILAASREIFAVTDRDNRILYVSPGIEMTLGYRPEELLGRTPNDLFAPQDMERALRDREAARRRPGETINVTPQMVHRDGSLRAFEGTVVNLLENPYLQGFVINLNDVTERETLRRRSQEARRLEGIGRLAGGVAHDFNNILTVVLGQVELMEGRAGDDPRLNRGLAEIRAAADRATGLVSQLLAFARRSLAAPRTLELEESLKGLRPALEQLLGPTVALSLELSANLPPILADPLQVERVLLNMSANARDAMPQGGTLRIKGRPMHFEQGQYQGNAELRPGDYVQMTVADTGQGMDQVTLEHAFEPFFTTKPSGRGTGMGLATCYGIVRQAGGHIEVHSRPGLGTQFDVFWPVAVRNDPAAAQVSEQAPLGAGVPRGTGEQILVVDDEAQVLALVVEGLTALGYKVEAFSSPVAALSWLGRGQRPHLLITDMVMPEMGGEALAGRVQLHAPALPVLYISGYAASAIARQSWLKIGVNFLPKPFALPDLAHAVRRLLDGGA